MTPLFGGPGGGPGGGPVTVTVRVPATSANLGPGFDALGLALDLCDDVVLTAGTGGGLAVTVAGEGAGQVPTDDRHLVVRAARAAFGACGVEPGGLRLHCVNRVPQSRGLGSSAAAIVAGVVAARAAIATAGQVEPAAVLTDDDTLALAAELEGHPDNVAACLLGGATVAWAEAGRFRAARLRVGGVRAVAFVPPHGLSTETARAALPLTVPHRDAAASAGRAALLVEALRERPDLLLAATEDRLHQEYRRSAMPESLALVDRLRAAGHAAVVSGAGPTVLVLQPDPHPDHRPEGGTAGAEPLPAGPGGWAVLSLAVGCGALEVA